MSQNDGSDDLKPNQARVMESGVTVIRWTGPDGALFETRIGVVMHAMGLVPGWNPLINGPVVNFTLGTVQEHKRISGPATTLEDLRRRSVPPEGYN